MMIDLPAFVSDYFGYVMLVAAMFTMPMALFADGVFGDKGLGLVLGYLVLMIGSVGGVTFAMVEFGSGRRLADEPILAFGAAMVGAMTLYITIAFLRSFLRRD